MTRTTTKKNTDPFAATLVERETAAIEQARKAREALAATRATALELETAVESTEEVLDELTSKVRAGDPSVTGLALVEARANHEVAQMGLDGVTARAKRLVDRIARTNLDKAIAEIVRHALVAHVLPGATAYATFNTTGFARDAATPDALPALVVTQLEGGIPDGGVGEGRVRITYHRGKLHMPLDADRLRAALEGAGLSLDRRFAFDGLTAISGDAFDEVVVQLRNVAESVPAVTRLATDVEGWDFGLAQSLAAEESSLSVEGVGASIVGTDTSDDITQTRVKVTVAGQDTTHSDRDPNGPVFHRIALDHMRAEVLGKVRAGLGRCIGVDLAPGPDSTGSLVLRGRHFEVAAVQFTFASRTPPSAR